MSARDELLARIAAALGPQASPPPIPRRYHRAGAAYGADVVTTFAARVGEYRATIHRSDEPGLPGLLRRLTAGERVVATAPFAASLDGAVADDPPLPLDALDRCDTAVTGCAVAIADTGTIVLDGAAASGRRALTLIPDRHVCVVRRDQLVARVPDAIAVLAGAAAQGRPITFVSGPSATSDIELERVEGVHGPRRLDVLLVG